MSYYLFKCTILGWLPFWARHFGIDYLGVQFVDAGDIVIWTWPWQRDGNRGAFISLGFSGTGEWGDARFHSLQDIREEWKRYEIACQA